MTDRTIEGTVLLNVVEDRIAALWRYRSWYREHRWAEWPLRRVETDTELRALVRLARRARSIAAKPVTVVVPVAEHDPECDCIYIAKRELEERDRLALGDHFVGMPS